MIGSEKSMAPQAVSTLKLIAMESFPYILAVCVLLVGRRAIGDLIGKIFFISG